MSTNSTPDNHRRPGEWPVPPTFLPDNHRAQINKERARWHITLGAIRGYLGCPRCCDDGHLGDTELTAIRTHLEEQPSARAIREAAHRWANAITQLAEQIIRERR